MAPFPAPRPWVEGRRAGGAVDQSVVPGFLRDDGPNADFRCHRSLQARAHRRMETHAPGDSDTS